MRQKWHEQFVQPRYRALFSHVPTYWEVDDHDYRIDDGDNSGDHLPSVEMAVRMMYEQLPYAAMGDQTKKPIEQSEYQKIFRFGLSKDESTALIMPWKMELIKLSGD